MSAPNSSEERFHRNSATRRFRQRTEATRERDVIKHLQPWSDLYQSGAFTRQHLARTTDQSSPPPQQCKDTALLAFGQLVTLRLGYRRSFVSLLSTRTEYVLAEATRTMSFQYSSVKFQEDKPWIGTCTFPSTDGLGSLAIGTWRSARRLREEPTEPNYFYTSGLSPHWQIISDIRHSSDCEDNAFAKHADWARYYFAVPLRTAQGSVIGSLAVMDDRPRYGVSSEEMSFMEDMADTITEHLHSTIVRSQRQRSERLIQALGLFNRGETSLRDWWLGVRDLQLFNAGRHAENTISQEHREALGDEEFGARPASSHTQKDSNTDTDTDTDRNTDTAGSATRSEKSERLHERKRTFRSGDFNLADATEKTYARASNLLREALVADGAAFVDISSISSTLRRDDSGQSRSSPNDNSQTHDSSEAERSDSGDESTTYQIYGCSLRQEGAGGEDRFATGRLGLSKMYTEHLLRRYPHGHVFDFSESGNIVSSGDGDNTSSGSDQTPVKVRDKRGYGRHMRAVMTNARTVAFYPLKDDSSGRWRAGVFVWSIHPLRIFDEREDLTYLSAFGHSLMAELSRLETLAADKAKATFISSISHELRSPLHGVLAGVEFLQETELSLFQQEMSHTILKAGRTLLDTINHLLDHSKISNFSSSQRRRRAKADSTRHKAGIPGDAKEIGVTSNIDLAQLTEDLVETVVSAHRYQYHTLQSPRSTSATPGLNQILTPRLPTQARGPEDVSIVLSIPYRKNWCIETQSGSWTRIVTNLVSNALKYTEKGTISVSLEGGEKVGDSNEDARPLSLIVEDSGIGISDTFLKNDLYTPFTQENSHSTGTGLGLSVVKNIAKDLGAQLHVTSQIGRGTRVELTFQPKFVETRPVSSASHDEANWTADSRDLGLDVLCHIDLDHVGKHKTNAEHTQDHDSVLESVFKTSEDWLGCKIVRGTGTPLSENIRMFTITEQDTVALAESRSGSLPDVMEVLARQDASLLVLGGSIRLKSVTNVFDRYGIKPIYVPLPIGPGKLMRAVTYAMKFEWQRESPGSAPSGGSVMSKGAMSSRDTFETADSFPWTSNIQQVPGTRDTSKVAVRPLQQRRSADASKRGQMPGTTPLNADAPQASSSSLTLTPKNSRDTKHVMLVEDNEINMKLLVALVKKLKLPYQCAVNGKEAVDLYRNSPSGFFLILMDLTMPVMDGHTSTAEIRKLEKELHLPETTIVALTGVTNEDSKQRAFDSGVDEYYTKPIHMKDVKKLVETARRPPS